jgi:flagellar protein FlaF
MYLSSYNEIMEDDPQLARTNERGVILKSIRLLDQAEKAGPGSNEAVEALLFFRRLWEFLLLDLANSENQLPEKLRADLISIGIGLLREADAISRGESNDFASLKEISQAIVDGLR